MGREKGAQHFVLLSAICVQKPLLEFQKAKLKFESELQVGDWDGLDMSGAVNDVCVLGRSGFKCQRLKLHVALLACCVVQSM